MQERNRPLDGIDAAPATTAEIVERMTSRLANSLVIAAGILGLGIYWSGDSVEAPNYQAVAMPDGRLVRLNTESGSVVSCDAARCTIIQLANNDLEQLSDEERAALQAVQERLGIPAGPQQPGAQQPGTQQALPAPAQTPAGPQNQAASPAQPQAQPPAPAAPAAQQPQR